MSQAPRRQAKEGVVCMAVIFSSVSSLLILSIGSTPPHSVVTPISCIESTAGEATKRERLRQCRYLSPRFMPKHSKKRRERRTISAKSPRVKGLMSGSPEVPEEEAA